MKATDLRSGWRYFPHAMIGAIGLMVAIDSGLAWTAVRSFPGVVTTDAFDHSNAYDQVLAIAAHEAALGWTVRGGAEEGRAVVLLTGRDGAALQGAALSAIAARPLAAPQRQALVFHEAGPGRYVADASLPQQGQWDLRLEIRSGDDSMHATRRVIVK